jgi:hypothetical protein
MMFYNFARFHSPFDFGATYNLTDNDMTSYGFVPARIPRALYVYLLQPLHLTPVFPFLQITPGATNYVGQIAGEATYGGILAVTPFLWIVFLLLARPCRRLLRQHSLLWPLLAALLLALLICNLDMQIAGLYRRYLADFSFLFSLVAATITLALYQKFSTGRFAALLPYLKIFIVTSLVLSVFYHGLVILLHDQTNSNLYYLQSLIQFWG